MTIPEYPITREEMYLDAIARGGGGGGGVTVTSLSVTENGTYTAPSGTAYSPVTVDVQGSGGYAAEDFLFMDRPTGEFYSELVSGGSDAAMKNRSGITSINMPNYTYGTYSMFNGCAGVTSVHFPVMTGCSSMFLYNCRNLQYFVLPMGYSLGGSALYGCTKLNAVDLGGTPPADEGLNGASTFMNSSILSVLVLRSATVIPLANINTFSGTPFASDKSGGTLYVPQALIASYQAATNWSTILGYANNQILPIEGSIYETQYADGTPIPTA